MNHPNRASFTIISALMDPKVQPSAPPTETHPAPPPAEDVVQHPARPDAITQSSESGVNGTQNSTDETGTLVKRTARLVVEEIRPKYSLPQEDDDDDDDASEDDGEGEAEGGETGDLLIDYPSDAEVRTDSSYDLRYSTHTGFESSRILSSFHLVSVVSLRCDYHGSNQ